MKKILLAFFLAFTCLATTAQNDSRELLQFSGVVVNGDSLLPVPFASVIIKNTNRGTISDYYGFFSFVARQGDTIRFSSIGYKSTNFIIPDSLPTNRYSIIQILEGDTIELDEAIIYPWPSKEQFKEAFLALNTPEGEMEYARKNLARAAMLERYQAIPMDGRGNYKYSMQQRQTQLYYAGQAPPISVLNPIAWAKFIDAWKKGDFKKDK